MDELKLHGTNERETDSLVNTIKVVSEDIDKSFRGYWQYWQEAQCKGIDTGIETRIYMCYK